MRNFLLAFLLLAEAAFACSCVELTECWLAERPVIFVGKVVAGGVESIREDPWYTGSKHVRFEVVEALRGLAPGTKFVELKTLPVLGMCAPNPYYPGRTYLVTPGTEDGILSDGGCFSGRDVRHLTDTIEYLRRHVRNPGFYIRGRVGAVERNDSGLVGYLIDTGEGKALQGVTVSTTAGGIPISTTTDTLGRYELAVPRPGRYEVQAHLAPYQSAKALVGVPRAGGCTVENLGLLSNSSISGKILDRQGQPLKNMQAGLIDLDQSSGEGPGLSIFRAEYQAGSFLFENVPLGRYLLVSNPHGPQSEGFRPNPLERTFYPKGALRGEAATIEIEKAGMRLMNMDLIAGSPAAFRRVTVSAVFPDRSPMTTALITITGEPIAPDGLPWIATQVMRKEKLAAEFQVPANRMLRISVKDWHGRDLKEVYESTHDPGDSPINQEFIIVP